MAAGEETILIQLAQLRLYEVPWLVGVAWQHLTQAFASDDYSGAATFCTEAAGAARAII